MDFFWKIWKIRNATLIWRADLAARMSPKCTMNDPGYNVLATRARLLLETNEGGLPCGE